MFATGTGRGSIMRMERKWLLAESNRRRLQQYWLSYAGKQYRAILTVLLRHADGRRLIAMCAENGCIARIETTGVQLGYVVKVYTSIMPAPKRMGVQQGRKALQQRQQDDQNEGVPVRGHGRILNLI